jgi:predicted acylesterase/phospholipase RssA
VSSVKPTPSFLDAVGLQYRNPLNPQDLRNRRIGLVLSGGGAKGAYHIGCLKALREAGIDRFAAIAGSSVGAINAVCAATGRLDTAERAWRGLGPFDVVRVRFRTVWRLPLWLMAALGSEFSPFKISRLSDRVGTRAGGWIHPAVCIALGVAIWLSGGPRTVAAVPLALALLTLLNQLTRPIFLRPVFTDNAPLSAALNGLITSDELRDLRGGGVPVYGVLSERHAEADGAHQWGGWAPQYVRLDREADVPSLCRTLLDGSAVPGFLAAGSLDGRPVLDGAWTDNMPAAPLLYGGHELDAIFVVYLKQTVRHTPRHNSLCGVAELLLRDAVGRRSNADLHEWSRIRWAAYRSSREARGDTTALETPGPAAAPLLIPIAPSRRIGNFFTGTLWFSRTKSAALIDAGERDMRAVLARLATRDTPRDIPAAAPLPALASRGRSILRALWPLSDGAAAE